MALFEFLTDYQYSKTENWVETTATFTGKRNKAASRTKTGFRELDYYEYELIYFVGEKKQRGFYTFHPIRDPEPDKIAGTTIQIKYNRRKPYQFKPVQGAD